MPSNQGLTSKRSMGIEVSKKKCHKTTAKRSESQEIADQIIKLEINELTSHKTMDEGSSCNNIGHKLKPRRYIYLLFVKRVIIFFIPIK